MSETINAQNYVFKFGKFNKFLAQDVVKISTVDKNNKSVKTGLLYMKWLVDTCDWFKHKDIIKEIIEKEEGGDDADDESTIQPTNKPEKQPKQPKEKKIKEVKVKIDIDKNKLDFE